MGDRPGARRRCPPGRRAGLTRTLPAPRHRVRYHAGRIRVVLASPSRMDDRLSQIAAESDFDRERRRARCRSSPRGCARSPTTCRPCCRSRRSSPRSAGPARPISACRRSGWTRSSAPSIAPPAPSIVPSGRPPAGSGGAGSRSRPPGAGGSSSPRSTSTGSAICTSCRTAITVSRSPARAATPRSRLASGG